MIRCDSTFIFVKYQVVFFHANNANPLNKFQLCIAFQMIGMHGYFPILNESNQMKMVIFLALSLFPSPLYFSLFFLIYCSDFAPASFIELLIFNSCRLLNFVGHCLFHLCVYVTPHLTVGLLSRT